MSHSSQASPFTCTSECSQKNSDDLLMLAGTDMINSGVSIEHFYQVDNFFVIEEPNILCRSAARSTDTGPSGGGATQAKKISVNRWKFISRFHLIEPPVKNQLYVCQDLNLPHYQVGKTERREYIRALGKFLHANDGTAAVTYSKETNYARNKFLTVINDENHCSQMKELTVHFNHPKAREIIHRYKESPNKVDAGRGNIFFDRGLSCSQNLGRDANHLGLAVPRIRSVNASMSQEDKDFCDKAECLLLNVMKANLPLRCKGKEHKLYNVPPTNADFKQDSAKYFQASRFAETNSTHVVNCHCDRMNPSENEDLEDSFMNQPVGCFSVRQGDVRCSVIGYGRESVVNAAIRKEKYGPCLQTIIDFYNTLPISRKVISSDLVKELSTKAKSQNAPYRFPLHTNKMVTYSVYIDRILTLSRRYHLDIYHRIPLVYSAILSESPDYFMKVTDQLMKQPMDLFTSPDVLKLATYLYENIWKLKLIDSEAKKKDKRLVLNIGQRHGPTVNKKGTIEGLHHSIKLMASMHHACNALSDTQLQDMHYFVKTLSIFSVTKGGVMHAGDLLSQHLIVIGSAVGVFPLKFSTFGELGNTRCRESLQSRFNLFQRKNEEDFSEESANILKALSFVIKETLMFCENLTCKEMQALVSHAIERWVESYYPTQTGLYNNVTLAAGKEVLRHYTANGYSDIKPLPMSYNKTCKKLVSYCKEEALNLMNKKTSKTLTKKQGPKNNFGEKIKFNPIPGWRMRVCPHQVRSSLKLESLTARALGLSTLQVPKQYTQMITRTQRNTVGHCSVTKKKIIDRIQWYRLFINAQLDSQKKKIFTFKVNDKKALLPIGFNVHRFKDQVFFDSKNNAREYLFMNYLLQKKPEILASIYDMRKQFSGTEDNESLKDYRDLLSLTIPERDDTIKREMNPHYAMVSASPTAFVIYSCDDNGDGSSNRLHWKPVKKIQLDKTSKKRKRT